MTQSLLTTSEGIGLTNLRRSVLGIFLCRPLLGAPLLLCLKRGNSSVYAKTRRLRHSAGSAACLAPWKVRDFPAGLVGTLAESEHQNPEAKNPAGCTRGTRPFPGPTAPPDLGLLQPRSASPAQPLTALGAPNLGAEPLNPGATTQPWPQTPACVSPTP